MQCDDKEDILSPSAPRRGTDVHHAVTSANQETTSSQLQIPTGGHKDDDQVGVPGRASGDEDIIVLQENTVYDVCKS